MHVAKPVDPFELVAVVAKLAEQPEKWFKIGNGDEHR
jgi:hypothetical protein